MTKNPLINTLSASLYIGVVSSLMFFGSHFSQMEDTVLIPIAMLSLFTLSAAVMAFLFFYQPVSLLAEGDKKAAFAFLLQTIGSFAAITATIFATLFFVSFFR
jgi:hypothetical protein